ncbi:hypothetical protein Bbelb_310100 [Branchiostoma belcheri]|nr:hypothetical protein Bbelb_310100 [Branchiostoma belcheri]
MASPTSVTTRRTCFCVLSTCKNVGKRRASVRGEYHLRTESYGFGSTQTRRRTLSACNTFSTCGLRIYHPCVRVRATRVPRTAYERATYGLLYKDDLTGDCQLVSKMPKKAQKKSTRQDPKKRAAEDTRAASDDEVNKRCTHLQRASTACTRQRGNRTEIVRCKHVQLTYHLRNVRCTQPLTARRVVQTTYVHLASDVLPRPATLHGTLVVEARPVTVQRMGKTDSQGPLNRRQWTADIKKSFGQKRSFGRTYFCVLSTCKNLGKRRASVRGEYRLRTESYGFGSTQTRRRTLSACKTFFCVRSTDSPPVRASTGDERARYVPYEGRTCEYASVTTRRTCFCVLSTCKNVGNRTASVRAYERATYGLSESNFTIPTCNCCTDSARSTCVPRTVLAPSVLTPHFPVDLLNDHAEHTCTIPVYKDDLTGDCQLVSKMPKKAQKKTTRQDPKKRAAEDTRAASDDEVNRRCTHLQRASTACTRQRSNRTEIVRCKHVQLTYHLRNVRCTQPLTARRVVQTTYVHLAQPCE